MFSTHGKGVPVYRCGRRRMTYRPNAVWMLLLISAPLISWAQTPKLNISTEISSAGYFQLTWQSQENSPLFELVESTSTNFAISKVIYEGHDAASVISGRSNGEYFYRVRIIDTALQTTSKWSNPVRVSVEHHSLAKALGFFFIGLCVFISTLLVIIRGTKQSSQQG